MPAPPVGIKLRTASHTAEVSYKRAIVVALPFYASHLSVIVLISVRPEFVPWLPGLFE